MSDQNKTNYLGFLVIAITLAFTIFEVAVSAGIITTVQINGFLGNLTEGGSNWYLNPIPWVFILAVLVNFAGYIENTVINHQPYDISKFAETWLKYLPLIIVFSQISWGNFIPNLPSDQVTQMNIGITATITVAIDIITRAIKYIKTNGTTTTTTTTTSDGVTTTKIEAPA